MTHCGNLILCRMQKMALEYNEKIETVNRERKFHQVANC
jgi:pre-mRNA-splicing factor SPF27